MGEGDAERSGFSRARLGFEELQVGRSLSHRSSEGDPKVQRRRWEEVKEPEERRVEVVS